MNEAEIIQILKDTNALLEGHFVLTSGLHSPHYIEKFRVLEHPHYTERLCKAIAEMVIKDNITAVVGPMTGGIILSYEVGKQLGVKSIFTERVDGTMKFRRGFTLSNTDNILIVEDIITTGGSVLEVIEAVKVFKCNIAAVSCLVDRSNGKAVFGVPFRPLLKMNVIAFKPNEVPEWLQKIHVTKPGSTNK